MPYIDPELRAGLTTGIAAVTKDVDTWTTGMLNYVITRILMQWLEYHGKTYKQLNEVIGVLETCKIELYLRVIQPYERKKAKTNGDVY